MAFSSSSAADDPPAGSGSLQATLAIPDRYTPPLDLASMVLYPGSLNPGGISPGTLNLAGALLHPSTPAGAAARVYTAEADQRRGDYLVAAADAAAARAALYAADVSERLQLTGMDGGSGGGAESPGGKSSRRKR